MIEIIKEFKYGLLLIMAMGVGNYIYGPGLPEIIPSHFNSQGVPDDYMAKDIFLWIFPVVLFFIMVMISFSIRYSPKMWAMPNTRPVLVQMYFAIGCLLTSLHFGILFNPEGEAAIGNYFGFGSAIFLVVFGNILGKAEPNFFIGLRVPWTLASENNWNATHRLAGKLAMISGVLLFVTTFFIKDLRVLVPFVVVPFLVGSVYSFIYYLKKERPLEEE